MSTIFNGDSLDIANQIGPQIYTLPAEALFWAILFASWALRDRLGLDNDAITTECNHRAEALKGLQRSHIQ